MSDSGTKPRGFETVEHTADLGLRMWGATLDILLTEAARALMSVVTDLDRVDTVVTREISVRADSPTDLLVEWLDALNRTHQIHEELYGTFQVAVNGNSLRATVGGERIDPARHELRLEVKAVTWHDLHLAATDQGYEARVLLDI